MGDQMVTDQLNQSSCFQSSYPVAISKNSSQQEEGYTVLSQSSLCVDGGVNDSLDPKADKEIVSVGTSRKTKGVDSGNSSRFTETGSNTSHSGIAIKRVVRVPASQSDRDLVTSPDSVADSTRMDACGAHEKDANSEFNGLEKVEQQSDLCTSTVDVSPICDTSTSIFNLQQVTN